MNDAHRAEIQEEFGRAAEPFARRTAGRFDALDVVAFSQVRPGASVMEVGAGTGNFLSLFRELAGSLLGVDLTHEMLRVAGEVHEGLDLVVGDGYALPFASGSVDLVTSAQTFHHLHRPVPVLMEMRRVAAPTGRILVVDQVASERYEEAALTTDLETVRDPTHAASRPPSAMRIMLGAAGLRIIDERIVEDQQRFSRWMWRDEFPQERIDAVRAFVEQHGDRTGMGFEREGEDFVFVRRRMMLLAERV
ncbi:MAG: class I SAM-dependent methyltransferase [Actinomycetota bacterium]|nr:class I SAM-dependent methyltransferase [Actinomycetota bacterium]